MKTRDLCIKIIIDKNGYTYVDHYENGVASTNSYVVPHVTAKSGKLTKVCFDLEHVGPETYHVILAPDSLEVCDPKKGKEHSATLIRAKDILWERREGESYVYQLSASYKPETLCRLTSGSLVYVKTRESSTPISAITKRVGENYLVLRPMDLVVKTQERLIKVGKTKDGERFIQLNGLKYYISTAMVFREDKVIDQSPKLNAKVGDHDKYYAITGATHKMKRRSEVKVPAELETLLGTSTRFFNRPGWVANGLIGELPEVFYTNRVQPALRYMDKAGLNLDDMASVFDTCHNTLTGSFRYEERDSLEQGR